MDAECPVAMVQRCQQLKTIRSILYTIARLQSNNQLPTGSVPIAPYGENLVSVKTDEGGNLRIQHDPLLQALDGVEVRRIRECPVCGALYWAGRLDKPACDKCTHVLRQRRYRENYAGKYKLQRYRKAEETKPLEEKNPGENTNVQLDSERKKLESLHEHNSAHRTPRLPGGHK